MLVINTMTVRPGGAAGQTNNVSQSQELKAFLRFISKCQFLKLTEIIKTLPL